MEQESLGSLSVVTVTIGLGYADPRHNVRKSKVCRDPWPGQANREASQRNSLALDLVAPSAHGNAGLRNTRLHSPGTFTGLSWPPDQIKIVDPVSRAVATSGGQDVRHEGDALHEQTVRVTHLAFGDVLAVG